MNIIESLVDKVKNLNKETLLDIAISVIVIALFFMIGHQCQRKRRKYQKKSTKAQ